MEVLKNILQPPVQEILCFLDMHARSWPLLAAPSTVYTWEVWRTLVLTWVTIFF